MQNTETVQEKRKYKIQKKWKYKFRFKRISHSKVKVKDHDLAIVKNGIFLDNVDRCSSRSQLETEKKNGK